MKKIALTRKEIVSLQEAALYGEEIGGTRAYLAVDSGYADDEYNWYDDTLSCGCCSCCGCDCDYYPNYYEEDYYDED